MDPQSLSIPDTVNTLFLYLGGVSVLLLLLITVLMIYFVIRYSRKRHPEPEQIDGNIWLEIVWTVIPLIIVLGMFYYGFKGAIYLREPPEDAMKVKVTGKQWKWSFEYENGKMTDKLYLPVDRSVKLELISTDVVHSFYVPEFRIKEDAVPGKKNYLWFKPRTTGASDVFCAEYCGTRHAYMMSEVKVMEADKFKQWYQTEEKTEAEKKDIAFLKEKGCLVCHSTDGSKKTGPTFKGIFNRKTTVLRNGSEEKIRVDEDYLRNSITDPSASVVKGYQDVMPGNDYSEKEMEKLIEIMKRL